MPINLDGGGADCRQDNEEKVGKILGITSLRETGVTKGIRAIGQWIKENVLTEMSASPQKLGHFS